MKQTRLLSLVILPLALAFTGCKPSCPVSTMKRIDIQSQSVKARCA